MKVLLISGEYPPHMFGGGATFMYYLSRQLSRVGIKTTVVAHKLVKKPLSGWHLEYTNKNLRIIWVNVPSYLYPRHEAFQLFVKPVITRLIEENDIIHLNSGLYYPWLYKDLKKGRKPIIVTIHGDPMIVYKTIISNSQTKLVEKIYGIMHMKEASYTLKRELEDLTPVFVSKHLYDSLSIFFKISEKYKIIYNGIDFKKIHQALTSTPETRYYTILSDAKKRGYKILIYPARFYPIKNHIALIIALSKIIKKNRRLLLVFTNKGPTKKFIEKKTIELNLSNNIIFTDKIPYEEVLRIISLADFVPFPSLYEANPITVIESLFLNKTVIAFDLPYIKEILHYVPNKILVAKNIRNFIEIISKILEQDTNINLKGNHEQMNIAEKFNSDNMMKKYLKLYEKEIETCGK